MEMGADFMPLYPMWSSWFSFYARRRTSSHSNPSCSHRRFAREPPPPSPIPVMPGIRRRPPGEGPPGAGSKESGAYPQGARDPAPAAAVQRRSSQACFINVPKSEVADALLLVAGTLVAGTRHPSIGAW